MARARKYKEIRRELAAVTARLDALEANLQKSIDFNRQHYYSQRNALRSLSRSLAELWQRMTGTDGTGGNRRPPIK
jgi:hypothetical protein